MKDYGNFANGVIVGAVAATFAAVSVVVAHKFLNRDCSCCWAEFDYDETDEGECPDEVEGSE